MGNSIKKKIKPEVEMNHIRKKKPIKLIFSYNNNKLTISFEKNSNINIINKISNKDITFKELDITSKNIDNNCKDKIEDKDDFVII